MLIDDRQNRLNVGDIDDAGEFTVVMGASDVSMKFRFGSAKISAIDLSGSTRC